MVTYGFFNSVDGDRTYNADDFNSFFDGIMKNGVCENFGNALKVEPGEGMTVNINTGKAFIEGKWVKNMNMLPLELESSDASYGRYDAIVIKCDETGRTISFEVKTGTPAAEPGKPQMQREPEMTEYCLAYVYVGAETTGITAENITDTRADQSLCGYAGSIVQNTVSQYRNNCTTVTDTDRIPIGIAEYDSARDILLVFINGILMLPEKEYAISGTGSAAVIETVQNVLKGNTLTFVVLKSVNV